MPPEILHQIFDNLIFPYVKHSTLLPQDTNNANLVADIEECRTPKVNTICFMENDVARTCLGLTCKTLYAIFRDLRKNKPVSLTTMIIGYDALKVPSTTRDVEVAKQIGLPMTDRSRLVDFLRGVEERLDLLEPKW